MFERQQEIEQIQPEDGQIQHLENLLEIHQRRLEVIEKQIASFGELTAPSQQLVERDYLRREIQKIKLELAPLRKESSKDVPYQGLAPFGEEHVRNFFGRDALKQLLLKKIEEHHFLAVLGPSGSGKSSVVFAGLIPQLKAGGIASSHKWKYLTVRPGSRPLDTIAESLARLYENPGLSLDFNEKLHNNPRALLLICESIVAENNERFILVIDQFEEVWTRSQALSEENATSDHRVFIDQIVEIAEAHESKVSIILTMRADFFHRTAEYRNLQKQIDQHIVTVTPMSDEELREAIERPAEIHEGVFEPGLVSELIKQMHFSRGALPHLQFTLHELWIKAQKTPRVLRWADYETLGGVTGALANTANTILMEKYPSIDAQQRLRNTLLRLVQPVEETIMARRQALLADITPNGETAESQQSFLAPLIDARLLTIGRDVHEQTTIELSHEALLQGWPTLKRWIEETQSDLRLQMQLLEAAKEWQERSEDSEFLWKQGRIDAVDELRKRSDVQLSELDLRFIEASRIEAERIEAERVQLGIAQHVGLQLRYLRQAGGASLGAGLGYSFAFAYLTAALDAGPLLMHPSDKSDLTFLSFLVLFLPGAIIGFSIGIALWIWNSKPIKRRVGSSAIGAAVGLLCYAPYVFLANQSSDLSSTTVIVSLSAGALLGTGLGVGSSLFQHKGRRLLALILITMSLGIVGYLIHGFAPKAEFISALFAGAMIGGSAGLGLYITAVEPQSV